MKKLITLAFCVSLAACGGDDEDTTMDTSTMDTSPTDSSSDTSVAPADVTVRVIDEGTPKMGVDVIFHNADGSVLETIATDSAGEATRVMEAGTIVTVVQPDVPMINSGLDLYTYYDVQPGDVLVLGVPDSTPPASLSADLTVEMPAAVGGATSYRAEIGCDSGSSAAADADIVLNVDEDCLGSDSTVDVLAYAENGDGEIIAYSTKANVAVTNGGTPSVAMDAFTSVGANDRIGVDIVNFDPIEDGWSAFSVAFKDGVPLIGESNGGGAGSGSARVELRLPPAFFDGFTHFAVTINDEEGMESIVVYAEKGTTPQITYNRLSEGLPLIAGALIGQADPARPQMAWIVNGDVSGTDAGQVYMSWSDDGGMNEYSWMAIFPATMASVQAPALPDTHAELRPQADSSFEPLSLGFWDFSDTANYNEFRVNKGVNADPTELVFSAMVPDSSMRATFLECSVGYFASPGAFAGFGILAFLGVFAMRRRRH